MVQVGRPPTCDENDKAPDPKIARRNAVDSKEGRERLADSYRRHLGRDPRPGELNGWADKIANGKSIAEYDLEVQRSTEGKKVDHFRNVFGRDPQPGEMDRLGGDKEGDAFRDAIARSPEGRAQTTSKIKRGDAGKRAEQRTSRSLRRSRGQGEVVRG